MNKNQQVSFVSRLCDSVIAEIIAKIESGEVPEDWNGFELREYIALCFARQAGGMGKKRKAEFNNTIEVTNL